MSHLHRMPKIPWFQVIPTLECQQLILLQRFLIRRPYVKGGLHHQLRCMAPVFVRWQVMRNSNWWNCIRTLVILTQWFCQRTWKHKVPPSISSVLPRILYAMHVLKPRSHTINDLQSSIRQESSMMYWVLMDFSGKGRATFSVMCCTYMMRPRVFTLPNVLMAAIWIMPYRHFRICG